MTHVVVSYTKSVPVSLTIRTSTLSWKRRADDPGLLSDEPTGENAEAPISTGESKGPFSSSTRKRAGALSVVCSLSLVKTCLTELLDRFDFVLSLTILISSRDCISIFSMRASFSPRNAPEPDPSPDEYPLKLPLPVFRARLPWSSLPATRCFKLPLATLPDLRHELLVFAESSSSPIAMTPLGDFMPESKLVAAGDMGAWSASP
mmetsp:Transcript_16630/g.40953  ORF Transcript_16630/g.40953 Transcript_16630/m.40953 type:complete len:205 (-) Transcript_16630:249-863(-)